MKKSFCIILVALAALSCGKDPVNPDPEPFVAPDALLIDGPSFNARLAAKCPEVEKIIFAVGSATEGDTVSTALSRAAVTLVYDASSKSATVSTEAPLIRANVDSRRMFAGLASLKAIEGLGNLSMDRVEGYASMFNGCSSLESIDLSGFDTGRSESLDSLFFGCSSLKSLDCSSFDVRGVKTMRAMFAFCSGLDSLNVDNLETYAMTDGSYMFYKCTGLKKLSAVGLYSLNLDQDCSGLFFGDVNLGEIWLGANFFGAELDLNCNCACDKDTPMNERLASVPGKLDLYCATSVAKAFAKSSLRWINSGYEGADPIPVTFFQDRFGLEGPSNDTIKKATWAPDIPDSFIPDGKAFNLASKSFVKGSSVTATTTDVPAVKAIEFVTDADLSKIEGGCDLSLYGDGMVIATFKDGVLRYSTRAANFKATTSLDYMFDSYKSVKSISGLDKINVEKVTSASYMFNECRSLESLDLSSFAFDDSVTTLKYMFNHCSSLKSLDISKLKRTKLTGVQHMLDSTVAMTSLHIDVFPNSWSYGSYNDGIMGCSEASLMGAQATASNPCEVWTTVTNFVMMSLTHSTAYSEQYFHNSLRRKQFVEGRLVFRYPGRTNPWTVTCTETTYTKAVAPTK